MDPEVFRRYGKEVVDWVADYLQNVDQYPVMSQGAPGDIRGRLPASPPVKGEPMDRILADFRDIILPGVTHWNHPRFFAYFPANNSGPAILGELLSAGLGVNAMLWQTSPAATELEELTLDWLRQMLDLPTDFRGVIQDTASTSTLCALLCAREKTTGFRANESGFAAADELGTLRVYASQESHSSVVKGAKIAGFGAENVVSVAVDGNFAMSPADLEQCIAADLLRGLRPCAIVATVGTTSSTAIDPLVPVGRIARKHGLWLHVDAALAGSAAILPERRFLLDGVEHADSFVFNPHKWLFTNFDCSAYFTSEADTLVRTLSILPEYLRTDVQVGPGGKAVTDYRDWGIQLGRRFRALKLWFVLRFYGAEGLREKLREHIGLAEEFAAWIKRSKHFELLAPVQVNTVCFRCAPRDAHGRRLPEAELDGLNRALLAEVNAAGRIYLTHTKLRDRYTLRLVVGQSQTQREHVVEAWMCLRESAACRHLLSEG